MTSLIEEFHKATLDISKVVEGIPARLEQLTKLQSRYDSEVSDWEHLAEFENFNAAEGYHIAQGIKKARVKRRAVKEELEMLLEIKTVANNNSKLDGHLKVLDKRMTELSKRKNTRTYTARVRTDLRDRFAKCNKARTSKGE